MELLRTQSDGSSVHAGPEIMSIGELHRCILAKLTVKEVRRAINKYRDLMPKESDWNRKLSQSSKKPELGFRYLFRCGQIDDDNNRTLQKMLKYMDRYDILPYFHTLRYQDTCHTASDHSACEDPVDSFLRREVGAGENVLTSGVYRMERKRSTDQLAEPSGCLTRAKCRRLSSHPEPPPRVQNVAPPGAGIPMVAAAAAAPAAPPAPPAVTVAAAVAATSAAAAAAAGTVPPLQPQPQSATAGAFCDLRMRVRAEYQQIHRLLSNQLHSHRNDPAQRQFDLFFQASNTLNSHDLGDILCDIRFSDLHYLEAFWRDYVSGELAHAIKSVFVRHYLMDRFNPADVQVHISLDAADYHSGRQVLLRSYTEHYGRLAKVREAMQLQQQQEEQLADDVDAQRLAGISKPQQLQEAETEVAAAAACAAKAARQQRAVSSSQPSSQASSQSSQRSGGRRSVASSGGGSAGGSKRPTRSSTGS